MEKEIMTCWDYLEDLPVTLKKYDVSSIDWMWVEEVLSESSDPEVIKSANDLPYEELSELASRLRSRWFDILEDSETLSRYGYYPDEY